MASFSGWGQPPIRVNNGLKEETLSRQVELLEDASKSLTIQQVLAKKQLFKLNNQPFINPGLYQ